jgi:hypothetical protein
MYKLIRKFFAPSKRDFLNLCAQYHEANKTLAADIGVVIIMLSNALPNEDLSAMALKISL